MPHIEVNDASFYYEQHGQGRPLVLISGYGADHSYWQNVYPTLARHHQVLLFDNRGVGQTRDEGDELSSASMADDLYALMQALDIESAHIAGQSMGGTIAQQLAIQHPACIDNLILLNTTPYWRMPMLQSFALWMELVDQGQQHLSYQLLNSLLFSNKCLRDVQFIEKFIADSQATPFPQSKFDRLRHFDVLQTHDSRQQLNQISASTLVMFCEEDMIAPYCDARSLIDGIAGSQMLTLSGGHSSANEQPDTIATHILRFLSE